MKRTPKQPGSPPTVSDAALFVITLRPEPGDVPVEVRMRKLLKIALRRLGFRCVAIATDPKTPSIEIDP